MNKYTDIFICNNIKMSYEVFCPEKCEDLPLLIFLHGAGERGTDIERVNRWALPRLITEGVKIPAIVLCPQCPQEYVWDNLVRELKMLIDYIVERFAVKKDRICITGASMGGFGTWSMGLTYPDFFSAIAPVAGGGMYWRTPNLKTTPVYSVHGDNDDVVPISCSQLMVDGVNKNGGNAQLIVLGGFGHGDGIEEAYENTALTEWILKQRRTNFENVAEAFSEYF